MKEIANTQHYHLLVVRPENQVFFTISKTWKCTNDFPFLEKEIQSALDHSAENFALVLDASSFEFCTAGCEKLLSVAISTFLENNPDCFVVITPDNAVTEHILGRILRNLSAPVVSFRNQAQARNWLNERKNPSFQKQVV